MAILQVEEGHHQHDNAEDDKGDNPVKLIQPGEVDREDLDRHDYEETQTKATQYRIHFRDTGEEQAKRKERPEDRDTSHGEFRKKPVQSRPDFEAGIDEQANERGIAKNTRCVLAIIATLEEQLPDENEEGDHQPVVQQAHRTVLKEVVPGEHQVPVRLPEKEVEEEKTEMTTRKNQKKKIRTER